MGKITSGDINFDWGEGNVLDSNKSDYVALKLEGYFIMPGTPGTTYTVHFRNQDDDGSITIIQGTEVINDWGGVHGAENRDNYTQLIGGQTYSYTRFWSEQFYGAVLRQYWKIAGFHSDYVFMKGEDFFSE